MSIKEEKDRIQTRVWKAIAQSGLDLSSLDREDLEALVEIITDSVLLEVDEELNETLTTDRDIDNQYIEDGFDSEEKILWKGRPFLSISTEYVITNERLRIFTGLLGKNRVDVELIRVQDIDQQQNLRERLLNIGDISIRSHDSSHPMVIFNDIRNPQDVHEILRRAILAARKEHGLKYREEM